MYMSIGDNTKVCNPSHEVVVKHCTINQVEQELKKEGKLPSFKGFTEQEVIPDWLAELRKRVLQSYSGTFHFRIEGG